MNIRITLTEKGERTIAAVRERSIAYYESILGHLPEEDKRQIAEAFRKFVQALKQRNEGGPIA